MFSERNIFDLTFDFNTEINQNIEQTSSGYSSQQIKYTWLRPNDENHRMGHILLHIKPKIKLWFME
jgi:hypothetical protein